MFRAFSGQGVSLILRSIKYFSPLSPIALRHRAHKQDKTKPAEPFESQEFHSSGAKAQQAVTIQALALLVGSGGFALT